MSERTQKLLAAAGGLVAAGIIVLMGILLLSTRGDVRALVLANRTLIVQTRSELCRSIDADHNRQRAEIVRGEYLIYTVPSFKVLIASRAAERAAFTNAKARYLSIRRSRPAYCDQYRRNAVPAFPSLSDFRSGRVSPGQRKALSRPVVAPTGPSVTVAPNPAQRPHTQPRTPSRPHPAPSRPSPAPARPSPAPETPPAPPVVPKVCVTVPLVGQVCT